MKQRSLVKFLIVLIVLFGILYFVGYKELNVSFESILPKQFRSVQSQSFDKTSWKTLLNENGFSIKYPPPLKVLSSGMGVNETNAFDLIISSRPGYANDVSPALHINITPKNQTVFKDMSIADISKYNYEANQENKDTFKRVVSPLASTSLDNARAYTYTIFASAFSGKWGGFVINTAINNFENLKIIESESKGNYFIVVYSADDPIITSVVNTFRFTE